MGITLTESQRKWLGTLTTKGIGPIPIASYTKLAEAGLCEKTGEGSGRRGFVMVAITEAGRNAL